MVPLTILTHAAGDVSFRIGVTLWVIPVNGVTTTRVRVLAG